MEIIGDLAIFEQTSSVEIVSTGGGWNPGPSEVNGIRYVQHPLGTLPAKCEGKLVTVPEGNWLETEGLL